MNVVHSDQHTPGLVLPVPAFSKCSVHNVANEYGCDDTIQHLNQLIQTGAATETDKTVFLVLFPHLISLSFPLLFTKCVSHIKHSSPNSHPWCSAPSRALSVTCSWNSQKSSLSWQPRSSLPASQHLSTPYLLCLSLNIT